VEVIGGHASIDVRLAAKIVWPEAVRGSPFTDADVLLQRHHASG